MAYLCEPLHVYCISNARSGGGRKKTGCEKSERQKKILAPGRGGRNESIGKNSSIARKKRERGLHYWGPESAITWNRTISREG